MESLFNSAGKQIAESLGEMVSKLLQLSTISKTKSMKFKIKQFYNLRSNYIHGDNVSKISNDNLIDLRKIVRQVILLYIMLCKSLNYYEANYIINYISFTEKDNYPPIYQIYTRFLNGDALLDYLLSFEK